MALSESNVNEEPAPKDLAWLGELQSGKLLGRGAAQAMPLPMKIRLLELGLVEETPGGLAITAEGRSVLARLTGGGPVGTPSHYAPPPPSQGRKAS